MSSNLPLPSSLLNETHLQTVQNGLNTIAKLEAEIALAKRAGIDTSAYEQQVADTKQKLLGIKNVYFPGR